MATAFDDYVGAVTAPANVDRSQVRPGGRLEPQGRRRLAGADRNDQVRRAEDRRTRVRANAVGVVVRHCDRRVVLPCPVDEVAEQRFLRPGARGGGDRLHVDIVAPWVDDQPHRPQPCDQPRQRLLVVRVGTQSTDEKDLVQIRVRRGQLALEVGDRRLAHPQHPTADRRQIEKALRTSDGGDRRPQQSVPVDLLPPIEPREPASVSKRPCDCWWSLAARGRPHAGVTQPCDPLGQLLDVAGAAESIAGTVLDHRPA